MLFLVKIILPLVADADQKYLVRHLKFEGNQHFSDKELSEISGIQLGKFYGEDLLDKVIDRILIAYADKSYLFATAKVNRKFIAGNQLSLRVNLNEGKIAQIGKITIENNQLFSESELMAQTEFSNDKNFNRETLENFIDRIIQFYGNRGYPKVEVEPINFELQKGSGKVNFGLKIREGEKMRIGSVKFRGLNKTKKETIERELSIGTGNIFDRRKLDESLRKIEKIGYFSDVKIGLHENSKNTNLIDVELNLVERRTGKFSGVIGYSPAIDEAKHRLNGLVLLSDLNLFGTGRQIDFQWRSANASTLKIIYREPWIFGKPIDLEVEHSRNSHGNLTNEKTFGFSLGSNFDTLRLQFGVKTRKVSSVHLNGSSHGGILRVTHDTRNSHFLPTDGQQIELKLEISEGDFELRKMQLALKQHIATFPKQNIAIGLHGAIVSGGGDRVPTTEMLNLGGTRTLRGYDEDQFRGVRRFHGNIEYQFTIGRSSQFFVFVDAGAVAEAEKIKQFDRLRFGYGGGVKLRSENNLLGIDYGIAAGNSLLQGKIHLNITTQF